MTADSFEGGEPRIIKRLPGIVTDDRQADAVAGSTDQAGASVNMMTTGNFFVSLLLGGSMEHLWGMIRALQMIVLSTLIDMPMPALTLKFFQGCI